MINPAETDLLITLKLFVLHHWVRGDTKSEVRMLDAGCWKLDGHF